jgi:hypothetical protein
MSRKECSKCIKCNGCGLQYDPTVMTYNKFCCEFCHDTNNIDLEFNKKRRNGDSSLKKQKHKWDIAHKVIEKDKINDACPTCKTFKKEAGKTHCCDECKDNNKDNDKRTAHHDNCVRYKDGAYEYGYNIVVPHSHRYYGLYPVIQPVFELLNRIESVPVIGPLYHQVRYYMR